MVHAEKRLYIKTYMQRHEWHDGVTPRGPSHDETLLRKAVSDLVRSERLKKK